ncbi:MAG: hypothetical protein HYR94_13340 [Chloroflexi bacterium]|nr:hypothetical protein [Chloroflexota bacterium]
MLADFYRREIKRLEQEREQRLQELIGQGVTTPIDLEIQLAPYRAELDRLQNYPRLIVETHLYGVDLDPQAAEIATVNLIMRAMADQPRHKKRLPLILNQNIKVGNALIGVGVGATLAVAPAAQGEDKPHPDDTITALAELRQNLAVETLHAASLQTIADIAAPFNVALNEQLRAYLDDPAAHRPFHWVVEFPEVFVNESGALKTSKVSETFEVSEDGPGFDIIVGNPPWEIIKPDLREFYAQFDPDIESKLARSQVEKRIEELNRYDPGREAAWQAQKAKIEAEAAYFQRSPDFTRQGKGDTATHKLFLERGYSLLKHGGRLGFVIPSGIYTDLGTKELREMLLNEGQIEYLYGLANVRGFFPEVDSRFKFTFLGMQKGGQTEKFRALFLLSHAEWPMLTKERDASAILADVITDENRIFEMTAKLIRRFSPDSLSLMEFKSKQDYQIAEKIYGDWPLMGEQVEGVWNPRLTAELHMTDARSLFTQSQSNLPLYEGKMFHQFDAYYAEPRFWVNEREGRKYILGRKNDEGQKMGYQRPRLAFRDIARSTDERTLITAILPPNAFAGNTAILETQTQNAEMLFLLAILNSFCEDYIIRHKVSTHVSIFYAYQLPLPRLTAGNPYFEAIVARAAALTCTRPEFAGLWQEVIGGRDLSGTLRENLTGLAERQTLRDELDALVAHLYGLSRADFEHILGTFPLVFPPADEGQAKKTTLLAVFDRFAAEVGGWPRR